MMQALEAGGLETIKSERRDKFNEKHSDELYKPNPEGLYEPTMKDMRAIGFPRWHDGKALKLVLIWLNSLAVHEYRVVFMRRNLEECRQSYEAAFGGKLSVDTIGQRVDEAILTLRNRKDVKSLTLLSYRDVIREPFETFQALVSDGWPIDPNKATQIIDPELCRFRLERLTVGL